MALREWANAHPKSAGGIAVCGVLVCLGWLCFQLMGDHRPPIGSMPDHYFSVDDGKSFFAANGSNIPPFDYQGRTAVKAHLFENGGDRFVGYLERYTPKARLAKVAKSIGPLEEINGREIKVPGDADWTPTSDHAAADKLLRRISLSGAHAVEP